MLIERRRPVQCLSVVLCIAAAFVSGKLLAKHVTGSSGSAWFEARCEDRTPGGADCAAVLATPYSYFPPKKANEAPGTPHIPVAFLGLVHFSTLAVWLIGVGAPSRHRRWVHGLTLLWVFCGLLSSARFLYIMFVKINEWCPWCLVTHVLNLLVAVCVVWLWPRRRDEAAAIRAASVPSGPEDGRVAAAAWRPALCHPTWTRLGGTIGVMLIVAYGNYGEAGWLAVRQTKATLQQCMTAVERIKADVPHLVDNWNLGRTWPITVRSDDPHRRGGSLGQPALDVVVFSDFECPSCSRLAMFFDQQVRPLFADRVDVVFKHFPMDRACNAHVTHTLHPRACTAARIAEAARLRGGNDAFWKAHDLLFARRLESSALAPLDRSDIAAALGIDPLEFAHDMASDTVTRRIEEDAALGRACEVRGTPAVFVNRKRVDPLATMEPAFWDRLADAFWKETGEPRPASTQAKPAASTQGNPDRPDGP